MIYRYFGKTGVGVSILGFGAMRLPVKEINGNKVVDEENSIKMIHRAFELGVNYIDTAYGYCDGKSEIVVGKAIKGWRDKIFLSTKSPLWQIEKRDDYRRFLDEQLKKLDVEYIDFYHFHSLDWQNFEEKVLKMNLIEEALKAKENGLIKHISFSFHDKPEMMKKIVDNCEYLETVLCQYNLIDRSNEEAIGYVRKKGIGVAVMGPIAGGRLSDSYTLVDALKGKYKTPSEICLRFVFSNENVSVALSGMNTLEMVEENCKVASDGKFIIDEEKRLIEEIINERKKKDEIPCTSCQYCMPCPQNIPIPHIFSLYNQYKVFEIEAPKIDYENIGKWEKDQRKKADACIECGQCEEKCPQKIKIREQLKKIHSIFS